MHTPDAGILISVAVVLAIAATHFNWRKWWYRNDKQFPPPSTKRSDLYFGFYGCEANQVAETRGSINLLMESQWEGIEKAISNIVSAGVDVMLDVSQQVFTRPAPGSRFVVSTSAADSLRFLFAQLKLNGVLDRIKVLYPIDEPNNTVGDLSQLTQAVAIIKTVAAEFPELNGYKLATTYAADKDFIGQALFDWVGFDDYDMKSSVLVSAKYKALVDSLGSYQRTMIIPGAAYGQDPTPFVNYAQANKEVAAIISFLWCDGRQADVGALGARSNGMAAAYLAAGASVK